MMEIPSTPPLTEQIPQTHGAPMLVPIFRIRAERQTARLSSQAPSTAPPEVCLSLTHARQGLKQLPRHSDLRPVASASSETPSHGRAASPMAAIRMADNREWKASREGKLQGEGSIVILFVIPVIFSYPCSFTIPVPSGTNVPCRTLPQPRLFAAPCRNSGYLPPFPFLPPFLAPSLANDRGSISLQIVSWQLPARVRRRGGMGNTAGGGMAKH